MREVIIKKIKPVAVDKRGTITDILNEKLNHVGLIVTEKGAVRGHHYHKLSTQYSYILSGKFEVLIAKVDNPLDIKKVILGPEELIIIPPMTIHTFKAIDKALMLDMVSQSRAGKRYERDTVRVNIKRGKKRKI